MPRKYSDDFNKKILLALQKYKVRDVAKHYNVSRSYIYKIKNLKK